jgi:hypothetical protein
LALSPLGQIAFDLPADPELIRLYYDGLGRRFPAELRNSSRFDEVRWSEASATTLIERSLPLKGGPLLIALPKDGEAAIPGNAHRWVLFLSKVRVTLQSERPRLLLQEGRLGLVGRGRAAPGGLRARPATGSLDFGAAVVSGR